MTKLFQCAVCVSISFVLAAPICAQTTATETADSARLALTPETLTEALSCQSRDAATAFASALFLDGATPSWMHEAKDEKATQGMLGLYGYQLSRPVLFFGEPIDHVYFMQDWVIALLPRDKANIFIASQKMERAPVKATEQYFRFIDPEAGPMLGVFEPTGDATAALLAKAFGGKLPPEPPSNKLFVGCNYTPVSQADFLVAVRQADELLDGAARDIGNATETKHP